MWEFVILCLEISFVFILSIKDSALSPFFPLVFRGFTEASLESEELQCIFVFAVVGVSQSIQEVRGAAVHLFSQLWEYLRASRSWKSISLGLSGSVGIKGRAVAETVAEAPKGISRALLYIVRAPPSFLHHLSLKKFYHTFHQYQHYLYARLGRGLVLTMRLLSSGCASDVISEAEKGPRESVILRKRRSEQSSGGEKDRADVRAG